MRRRIFQMDTGGDFLVRYSGLRQLGLVAVAAIALTGTASAQGQAQDQGAPGGTKDGTAECGYYSADADDQNGPPIRFSAVMNADEESAVTVSPGVGRVDFTLDRKTLKLSWKLTFSNLTSPAIGAGLRGPQTPGGEAGVLYDLSPGTVRNGAEGSAKLNEGELRYLVQDRLYVNILTQKYPAGEIRGQILKERPTCNAGKKTT